MICRTLLIGMVVVAWGVETVEGQINTVVVRNDNPAAASGFQLRFIPPPTEDDAAAKAEILIVDGVRDSNGGDLGKLQDGKVPTMPDQPAENFFFAAGTPGGRLLFDLGKRIEIDQVNTYSWHPSSRGPQVYRLYASNGRADHFQREPKRGTDPAEAGWRLITSVDTRLSDSEAEFGGQYGVSIFGSQGPIGTFRYLLFDISSTQEGDRFGNTFFSEIDVIATQHPSVDDGETIPGILAMEIDEGAYRFTIDTSEAPELTAWAKEELAPVVQEWYPKIVDMLPSDKFQAPRTFSIRLSPQVRGVASASGNRVQGNANWFQQNLDGEAKGAIVHELVHVVQQYGRARRTNPDARPTPGWLVEGIPDYIRWYLYEPESGGAEIQRRNLDRARYDGSYRISANFLNWVVENHDREVIPKLNAMLREGVYHDEVWPELASKTLEALGEEWKTSLEKALAEGEEETLSAESTDQQAAAQSSIGPLVNTLSAEEKAAGWKLLFDGDTLEGWYSFGTDGVRPGWQVNDGELVCFDPSDAGDLCTKEQFEWFELRLEYNISKGGNSGLMFRVTDEAPATWATGPEVQLLDNAHARDPNLSGWLYELYQPPIDPETGKPLDATKPAGEWNEIRLLVSPEKCVHEVNGVKYFEYVLGSEDFEQRVAKSKFRRMPLFAKAAKGAIALQGDHGQIAFRNIKIRPIETDQN